MALSHSGVICLMSAADRFSNYFVAYVYKIQYYGLYIHRCIVRWGWTAEVSRSFSHKTCRLWQTLKSRRCSQTKRVCWREWVVRTQLNRTYQLTLGRK